MSDSSQGPGWWQASDGKWYPPEQAPGYQPGGVAPAGGSSEIGAALSYGWNKFTQNIGELIVLWLVIIGVQIVFQIISNVAGGGAFRVGFGSGFLISTVFTLLNWVITGVIYIALARAALQICRGEKVDIGQCFQLSGPPLMAGILFGLIIGIGFVLCILPGIVAAVLLAFTPIIAADQNKGPESISEAWSLASSDLGNIFVILLVAALLSLFTCGIGAPIGYIALAYVYKGKRGEAVAA